MLIFIELGISTKCHSPPSIRCTEKKAMEKAARKAAASTGSKLPGPRGLKEGIRVPELKASTRPEAGTESRVPGPKGLKAGIEVLGLKAIFHLTPQCT